MTSRLRSTRTTTTCRSKRFILRPLRRFAKLGSVRLSGPLPARFSPDPGRGFP
jgi:hypothetical protein